MLQSRLKLDTLYLTHYSSICTNLSKIAKKLNIDLCQFFSHWKEALFLLKPWNKNGGHRTRFCTRAAESVHQMHFLRVLREDWGEFQNGMYMEGWGGEQKFNIHYRGSPLAGPTQQQTLLYIMHIPNTSSLISARNNPKRKFQ